MPIAPATQAAPSSSIAIAVTARVRVSFGSPTVSYSPVATSKRRRPGAPAAHRNGGLTASAVIGPASARSLIAKPPLGDAGPAPLVLLALIGLCAAGPGLASDPVPLRAKRGEG
jgi:hypothetical protein